MKTRRTLLGLLGTALLADFPSLLAQQKERVWRVGILASRARPESLESDFRYVQIRQELRELGYIEGKNLVIDARFAGGNYVCLPELAAELVKIPVDAILTDGTQAIRSAQTATKTVPIVFVGGADLVASGFVKSLARPGGNTTGISLLLSDTIGKQIEMLTRMAPGLSRLAVLFNPANDAHPELAKSYQSAGQMAKIEVLPVGARTAKEVEDAFSLAVKGHSQALIWIVDSFFNQQYRQIASLSLEHRLPSMTGFPGYADGGGLMCYGPSLPDLWARAVGYIDKIFKGANPGELPVQQPIKLDLVINKKTARSLGLEIPGELLLLADKVIE
jgi:putative ABC transport system substrate-binding protein